MRIAEIHIDGFGMFHDVLLGPIAPGLSVIQGDNEAGKSTLLAFVRRIFFGFPDRRGRENPYPPLRGGRYGGRIVVVSPGDGRYVIERREGPRGGPVSVTLPDGARGGEEVLKQLLGFATADVFRNVFAFSLDELQQFESLDDETVTGAIYSAGMGTGKVPLSELVGDLQKEKGLLFKPGGSKPIVNVILRELEGLRRQLSERSRDIEEFDRLHAELAGAERKIADLQRDEGAAKNRCDGAKRLLDAWEDWIELGNSEKELAELPQIDSFPQDGVARLERLEDKLTGLAEQIRDSESEWNQHRKKLDAVVVDERVLEQSEEITRLQRRRDHYDSALSDLPAVTQELNDAGKRVAEALRELGAEWDVERLRAFDTSIAERDVIRSHRKTMQEEETSLREAQGAAEHAGKAHGEAAEKQEVARKALAETPEPAQKDRAALDERREMLRKLARLVRRHLRLQAEKEHDEERTKDLESEKEHLAGQLRRVAVGLPRWPVPLAIVTGVLVGASLGALASWPAALALGGLLGVAAAGIYWLLRSRRAQRVSEERQQLETYLKTVEQRLAGLNGREREHLRSLAEAEEDMAGLCSELQVEAPSDEEAADALIQDGEDELEKHRRWTAALERVNAASEQSDATRRQHQEAKQVAQKAEVALSQAVQKWAGWLASVGLRGDVSPDGALEMVTTIGECLKHQYDVEGLGERIALMQRTVDEYRADVTRISERRGEAAPEPADVGQLADRFSKDLETARSNRSLRDGLKERVQELKRELEQLREKQRDAEAEKSGLLESAGAAQCEEFRNRAGIWERRQRLKEDANRRNVALEKIAGPGEHLAALEKELSQTTREREENRRSEAESVLQELRRALEAALDERGRLREQLRSLESEHDCGELRLRQETLLSRLRGEARKWSVRALAAALLDEARQRYERDRQPAVIRDASEFFRRITHEQYRQIVAPAGQATLQVLDGREERKQMDQLSRGAKEQLYFAVRLGLIREFGRRQEPLPVVMDDIFANFDPRRARAAVEAVLELTQTHQVLLFTCHPETCDLMREAAPSTAFFMLRDGEVAAE